MRRGNFLGAAIALQYFLLHAPLVLADDIPSHTVAPSLPATNADAVPPRPVITDRNGVVLDAASPALAYLRLGKNAGEQPLRLSLESQSNKILDDELAAAIEKYSAKGAAGYIMDVNSGEIIALSSIEGHNSEPQAAENKLNRITEAVYEIGPSARSMTIAMALDAGKADLASRIDGRELHYGKFTIHDTDPLRPMMTLRQAMLHASNIAAGRLAQRVGTPDQKAFLEKMGQLDALAIDGIDRVAPILPVQWTGLQTVVTAFGCGFAVSPLQAGMAVAALVNGGSLIRPTILKRSDQGSDAAGQRVVSPETSEKMRYLLRLNAEEGTAKNADVAGYSVAGATGTSEKVVNEQYARDKVITTFMAVYPADKPKYLVMVILDEPHPLRETHGYITSGWNAVPVGAKVIERTAPILGVEYRATPPTLRVPM